MNFEILIDDCFANVTTSDGLKPIDKKRVLSLANDFEDGKWRYGNFQSFIWDNIAETSLSARERSCLINQSHSQLVAAARNLRLTDKIGDVGNGSELAEIVLYGLMRHHYGALPVVPKIFYKQNTQDFAKGADSVHIVLNDENDFTIWFGEAKFYSSIEDARLGSIVDSVGRSLSTDKLKKENSIITNVSDIDHLVDDEGLRQKIKSALASKISIDQIKPRIHIAILMLHECSITSVETEMSDEYKKKIARHHRDRATAYFRSQLTKLNKTTKYAEIGFHLIVFPVPNKGEVVKRFLNQATHLREC